MKAARLFSLLAAALLMCARAGADTVVLKDGTKVTGTVIIEMTQKIVVRTASGNKIIAVDDIESVTKSARAEEPRPSYNQIPQPAGSRRARAAEAAARGTPASSDDPIANAVVKVYSTVARPDPSKPWARLAAVDEVGSGVVIDGHRILTSAHLIFHASEIQVKPNGAGDKISARVDAVAPLLDLAILKLDDDSFFATHPVLPRTDLIPRSRDIVSIYGYPTDSTNVEVIRASVTEVDYGGYTYPVTGYRIRTNQAFGPGISGAPCMLNDRMVGLACRQSSGNRQSGFSFVIPIRELMPFLVGVGAGGYRGKPATYNETQHLENPALREYLGIDPSVHGVVMSRPDDNLGNPFKPWDVVTAVQGEQIDDIGTVDNGMTGRQPYYSVPPIWAQRLAFTVVRGGRPMSLSAPTVTDLPMLVPIKEGEYPSYFIFGPIVFSAATTQVYNIISSSAALETILTYRGSPLVTRRMDPPSSDSEELVYIPSPFFPNKLVKGYSDPALLTVKSINGTHVKSLIHLVTLLRDSTDEFIRIEFYEKDSEILVFPRKAMIDATEDILNDNGVRNQGSPDTMAIWKAGT